MRRLLLAPTIAALVVAGPACSADDDSLFPTDPGGVVDVELPPAGEPFVELNGELYVTSDGVVYRMAAEPASSIMPLPAGDRPWEIAQLTPAGMERLLVFLDDHRFFDDVPEYEVLVTDTPSDHVIVTTADATYEHVTFAHVTDDAGAAYDRFNDVFDGLADLPATVDGEIGDFAPYRPDAWEVTMPFGTSIPSAMTDEPRPWPFATPPTESCTTFPDDRELSTAPTDGATGRYLDDGVVYDVAPRFPWDGAC